MLHGRFGNTSGRPYIEARLAIPRLQLAGDISFLVDTGADKTVLMPLDASRISVDYRKLGASENSVGIGGYSRNFIEGAVLAFLEPNVKLYVYTQQIHISTPSPEIANIPSLLGRDILDRWAITFDKTNDELFAEVLSADHEISVGGSGK